MRNSTDSDTVVQAAVIDELSRAPGVDSAYVKVAVNHGTATLSGEVDTYPEKRQAERAALRVRGVAAVVEQITVRGAVSSVSDAVIARAVNEALARAVDVPPGCVLASVHRRLVTLSGRLPAQHQRAACVRTVAAVGGVAGVVDHVRSDGLQEVS